LRHTGRKKKELGGRYKLNEKKRNTEQAKITGKTGEERRRRKTEKPSKLA
jgi:hypothetical protein